MMIEGPILVVGAHADDEALGAGATLALARRASHTVHTLILSTSANSRRPAIDEQQPMRLARRRDAEAVAKRLGASLTIEDFPDNAFDTVPALELTYAVERCVHAVRPRLVMTHWLWDLSLDHRATAQAVLTACRPQSCILAPTILSFEIRSSTEWAPGPGGAAFQPTVYIPFDEEAWSVKLALLDIYASELRPAPHARSVDGIDALARLRGSEVGCRRAEAFVLLRHVVKHRGETDA